VVGTGDPKVDVPAVQAAVDQGGEVILKGHLSFDREPTVPTALEGYGKATVLVSKAVTISGTREENGADGDGEMTSIDAGTIPFYVEAPGARVTIQALRFIRPSVEAILVYAVSGLTIASCKIEGGGGIVIDTSGDPFKPGHPENVSGRLLIANNDIDMAGGTARDLTLGIIIWYVGVPDAEVEAYLSGNNIKNFTERAIEIRGVGGRTYVEGNVIATGTIAGPGPAALHPIFVGDPTPASRNLYLIAHNSVDVQWPAGSAAGIIVRQAIAHAVVVDNDVNMDAPEGTEFDFRSAGIEIFGDNTRDNVVLNNRIRGRARAALSVRGVGTNNAFVLNRLDDFRASLADIFVDVAVMNTFIVGQGTVADHGVGTVIVPLPTKKIDHDEDQRKHDGKDKDH